MVSVRRYQKLPPCQIELILGDSKPDLLLMKVDPISSSGSISGITLLR